MGNLKHLVDGLTKTKNILTFTKDSTSAEIQSKVFLPLLLYPCCFDFETSYFLITPTLSGQFATNRGGV